MKLRYVFSAPSMIKLHPHDYSKSLKYKDVVSEGVRNISEIANKNMPGGFSISVDILFNAYTEKLFGEHLNSMSLYGMEKLYADSGGLQIVTRGHKVDDAIKEEIYRVQSCADYAFCFDEIPTRSLSMNSQNRATVKDKIFFGEKLKDCAIKTAENISNQCDIFDKIGAKTKVFYIVQGNEYKDMVEWFSVSKDVLKSYDRLAGVALADTCMGNGVLESVDMLGAYSNLMTKFSKNQLKNKIHLLGVGSVTRLMPFICGKNLLPNDLELSFDSTSLSMSFMMGKYVDIEGNNISKLNHKNYLESIIDMCKSSISTHYGDIDLNKFIQDIIKHNRSASDTITKSLSPELATAIISVINLSQLIPFSKELNRSVSYIGRNNTPLDNLYKCKTYDDYLSWRLMFKSYLPTKRINRKDGDLSEFF